MRINGKVLLLAILAATTSAKAADARTIIAAGAQLTEAIKSLGADATDRQISQLVYKAVKAQPDAVLQIVHDAVKCSPDSAADEIAAAAIAGVRDPWRHVIYYRRIGRLDKGGRDFKGDHDSKDVIDPDRPGSGSPNDPNNPNGQNGQNGGTALGPDEQKISETGQVLTLDGATLGPDSQALGPNGEILGIGGVVLDADSIGTNGGGTPNGGISMTIAQAIAETIFDTRPGLDHAGIFTAIDHALETDPTRLEQIVNGSRGISGVGDAGNNNYANEPRIPTTRPTPPPVSR